MHVGNNELDGLRKCPLKIYLMLTPWQPRRKEIVDVGIYCKMASGVDR